VCISVFSSENSSKSSHKIEARVTAKHNGTLSETSFDCLELFKKVKHRSFSVFLISFAANSLDFKSFPIETPIAFALSIICSSENLEKENVVAVYVPWV
jgi:hypothetical protein